MNPGKLRHKVTIERYEETYDELGQPIQTWTTLGTVPASVEPINGREYFSAAAAQSEVTTRIRIRYLAGLTSTDRVTHDGTAYNIASVINPSKRNEELVLMCTSAA